MTGAGDGVEAVDHRDLGAIIPSALDDAGLTTSQFRVYARMARRAGAGGECWESRASMAAACRMTVDTLDRAVRVLVERRMVTPEARPGRPTRYALTSARVWLPETYPETGGTP